jgi:transcriptional regulator with XRE-family HTH domain
MNKINFLELRNKKGKTQVEAASICGVSINTWIRWEKGVGLPDFENRIKLQALIKLPDKE